MCGDIVGGNEHHGGKGDSLPLQTSEYNGTSTVPGSSGYFGAPADQPDPTNHFRSGGNGKFACAPELQRSQHCHALCGFSRDQSKILMNSSRMREQKFESPVSW